jgi:hypothetical protein
LAHYIKELSDKDDSFYFLLLEDGIFISFKLENNNKGDELYFLFESDIVDIFLPTVIAIIASAFLLYRRR